MIAKTKYEKKCRLKKGDEVIVLAGKCRGDTGKIDRIDRKKDRIYIAGVNIYKRHTRPSMSNQTGGIIDKVMPLHVSNVALLDPKKKKPTRVGYKIEGDKKVRFAKLSGTVLS
jgi:large subunit ribosomal protein L24